MVLRHTGLSRRDAFLLLIGASSMHIWSLLFNQQQQTIFIDAHPQIDRVDHTIISISTRTQTQTRTLTQTSTAAFATDTPPSSIAYAELPDTSILAHAPGWTLFENLYMSNGTLFLVADESRRPKFPKIRMMASHPLIALNTPENIAAREPSDLDMTFITPEEAQTRWAGRVWPIEGNTILSNDPKQFLRHYYHLVAELFFGVQAFWHGFFSPTDNSNSHFSFIHPSPPPIHRIIFAYSNADGWRDNPGFNSYFLRGTLPSLSVEHEEDWKDRISATRSNTRAWRFPLVLLTDRSAAHRGVICGSKTQRTAAEAWDYMRLKGKLRGIHVGGWWAPLREAMWRFAGADDVEFHKFSNASSSLVNPEAMDWNVDSSNPDVVNISPEAQSKLPMPQKIVLTYIDRQSAGSRNLIGIDHSGLIQAIEELVDKKNQERKVVMGLIAQEEKKIEKRQEIPKQIPLEWEFNIMRAEKLTKDEQVKAAARTTIMFGLHGNGLTHLVWMQPNKFSTVIEIFCPPGFAHDYYWTSRALGMAHFAVWNDTYVTHPEKPSVNYPKCFQGKQIPVHGPTVAQLIEDRVSGKL